MHPVYLSPSSPYLKLVIQINLISIVFSAASHRLQTIQHNKWNLFAGEKMRDAEKDIRILWVESGLVAKGLVGGPQWRRGRVRKWLAPTCRRHSTIFYFNSILPIPPPHPALHPHSFASPFPHPAALQTTLYANVGRCPLSPYIPVSQSFIQSGWVGMMMIIIKELPVEFDSH